MDGTLFLSYIFAYVGSLGINKCNCTDAETSLADVGFRHNTLQQKKKERDKPAIEKLCRLKNIGEEVKMKICVTCLMIMQTYHTPHASLHAHSTFAGPQTNHR